MAEPLSPQHDFLNELQNWADIGWFEWELATDHLYWSKGLYQIFGVHPSVDPLSSRDFLDRLIPPDRERVQGILQAALINGSSFNFDETIRRDSGELRYLESRGKVVLDAAGQASKVLGVCRDVTELKQVELQLRHQTQQHQQLLEHARVVLWESDPQTFDYIFVSDHCERLLGYSRQEWLQPGFWRRTVHPDDRDAIITRCNDAIRQGMSLRVAYRFIAKSGAIVHVEDAVTPQLVHGELISFRGTIMDVTEQKSLEERLSQSQRTEAIGRLARGIAHDFNNILTVINSCSELLLAGATGRGTDGDLITAIQGAAARGTHITRQLLTFAKFDREQASPLELNDLIREMQPLLQRILGERGEIELLLCDAPLWLRAERGQLEQVLLNLVSNARDAVTSGWVRIATRLQPATAGKPSAVRLEVADNGPGMEPAIAARAFEPFFTTKSLGKGTGLGLTVVHEIVRQLHGRVRLESRPGQGTKIHISWPAVDPAPSPERREPPLLSADDSQSNQLTVPAAPPATVPSAAALSTANSNPTAEPVAKTDLLVLVVDDDPIIRQITCEILQAHGIQAQQASSVTEARELALSTPDRWDVLLTDISFRDGNGLELVRELRRQGLNLPVVIMSGIAPLDGNWGTEFGNLVFLPKPFPAKELIETVLSVAPLATPSPSTDRLPPKN